MKQGMSTGEAVWVESTSGRLSADQNLRAGRTFQIHILCITATTSLEGVFFKCRMPWFLVRDFQLVGLYDLQF